VSKETTIWIDAREFANYGGWLEDTQFVHLMGSAYLLAAATSIAKDIRHIRFQRCRIYRFDPMSVSKLKLTVHKTGSDRSARAFEIRAYRE